MPNNVFTITISATDKATATIRKVNDAMSKITRPFEEVGKSFKSLGREIGIDKIGKNLAKIGGTARNAARGVGEIVAPLAGITGMATIAGIVSLADSWGKLGRSITYSAQNIGIGTTQLQEFQAAARLAGLSGDTMTQSLNQLGNTMEDALYGRNQQALMLFNRLTGGIKRTKDGAVDITGQFKALAAAIYKLPNAQQQNLAAGQFGLTALLPLIRQGPKAFDQLIAKAKQLGIVMTPGQIASANAFATSMAEMGTSVTALKQSVGNALIPALAPLVKELTNWISKNRELISTKVTQWAQELGHWLASIDWKGIGKSIDSFIKTIQSVVSHFGGWKTAAIAAAVVMNGSLIASVLNLTVGLGKLGIGLAANILKLGKWTLAAREAGGAAGLLGKAGGVAAAGTAGWAVGSFISKHFVEGTKFGDALGSGEAHVMAFLGSSAAKEAIAQANGHANHSGDFHPERAPWFKQRQSQAMQFFMSKGWTKAQAAGIVGNLAQESTLNPNAVNKNGGAMGIGQWMGARAKQFQQIEGIPLKGASYDKQLDFVNWELNHSESRAGNALRHQTDSDVAATIVDQQYERPGNDGSLGRRIAYAQDAVAAVGPYSAGGGKTDTSKVHVEVAVKGLPAGTTANVRTSGATTAAARVSNTTVGAMS